MLIETYLNEFVGKLTPYQPGRPIEDVARDHGLDPSGIAKLASNECPLGPAPKAVQAIKDCATDMHRYPDGGGYVLKHKLAGLHKLDANQIVLGNGSNELLLFICQCFLMPGRSAVMSEHAFVIYKLLTIMMGADLVEVPMKGLTHDLDAMANAITPDTRVVFVCNPNNPTGSMVREKEIDAFMTKVPKDVLVVFDEAYAEVCLGTMPDTMKYIQQDRHVVILRTFSKAYGLAGLRIGYGMTTPELANVLEKPRQPFNVNRMAQFAACAALDDQEFIDESRELYRQGAAMVAEFCGGKEIEYEPTFTNFILIKVGDGEKVFQELQKKGVIVRPMGGYQLPEWIRISFGTEEENGRLLDALDEVLGS